MIVYTYKVWLGDDLMDIRTLQYYLIVVREKSITKAAQVLNMTQPPLSRAMKDLENELGKQLFIRGSKSITLTEEGLLLQKRAEEMINLMDKTINEIASSHLPTGEIIIASGETEHFSFIVDTAKKINLKYPEITYRLYSGDSDLVKEKIDNGLADFGLLIGTHDFEKYDYIKLPYRDRWGVLMNKNSSLSFHDAISADMLTNQTLIMSYQSSKNSEMARWLNYYHLLHHVAVHYELAYNASLFAKEEYGYMITLENLVNTQNTDFIFRPLSPELYADLYLIWKKNQVFSKASKVFLEELKNNLKRQTH